MHENIKRFGKLVDNGDSGDGKRTYLCADLDHDWKIVSIDIDTDDCDSGHAKAFKKELIKLWNSQQ